MDSDLALVAPGINLTEVDPIHQRRLLAFVNYWLSNTVDLLNNFARSCDDSLISLSRKLERVDASLILLEAKLSSIPGLDSVQPSTNPTATNDVTLTLVENGTDLSKSNEIVNNTTTEPDLTTAEPVVSSIDRPVVEESETINVDEDSGNTAKNDPRYAKFFKMLQLGVPKLAVMQKMQIDGLDGNLLENPGAHVPVSSTGVNNASDDDSDFPDTDSSFSD